MPNAHTPGPWFVENVPYQHAVRIKAQSPSSSGKITIAAAVQSEVDARLIAQAPRMDRLIAWLVQELDAGTDKGLLPDGLGLEARAILRAVKGE